MMLITALSALLAAFATSGSAINQEASRSGSLDVKQKFWSSTSCGT